VGHHDTTAYFHLHTSRVYKLETFITLVLRSKAENRVQTKFRTNRPSDRKRRNFSACIQIASCLNQRRSPEYTPLDSFKYLMNSLHATVPLLTQSFSRRETMGHVRHNKHLTGMKLFLGSDGIGTTTSDDISLNSQQPFLICPQFVYRIKEIYEFQLLTKNLFFQ